jgi:hypothetical protein
MAVPSPTPIMTRADRVLDAIGQEVQTRRDQINAEGGVEAVWFKVRLDGAGLPVSVEFQLQGKREVRRIRPGPVR